MKKIINFSFFTCLIVWIILLFAANQSMATTFCVSDKANLIAALNEAKDNGSDDVIKIQQGTYNGNFIYASTESFGVTIEGGYTALCAGRVVDPTNTILDGEGVGTVLVLKNEDADSQPDVFIVEGITLQNGNNYAAGGFFIPSSKGITTLKNNTISNNSGNGVVFGYGSSANLTNNTISKNSGDGVGLGWYTIQRPANLTNNTISNNSGYGVWFGEGSSANLTNNTITNNGTAIGIYMAGPATLNDNIISNNARGIYIRKSGYIRLLNNTITYNNNIGISAGQASVELINNTISYNRGGIDGWCSNMTIINNIITDNDGSGIYLRHDCSGGQTILTNNTISNNSTSFQGGGVYLCVESVWDFVNIYNNIIWNNNAAEGGADLYIHEHSLYATVNIYNNDFDQSANGTYIGFPFTIDPSNLDNEDPLFVDPDNDDFHLTVNSPCIDAGAGSIPIEGPPDGPIAEQAPPGFDIDGDSRPRDNGYDIGADEYPGPEYWTDDRMRDAVPPPMGVVVTMSEENELQEYVNQGFAPESEFMLITD